MNNFFVFLGLIKCIKSLVLWYYRNTSGIHIKFEKIWFNNAVCLFQYVFLPVDASPF